MSKAGKARVVQFPLAKKRGEPSTLLKRALNMREGGVAHKNPDRFSRARFLRSEPYRSRSAFKLIDLEQRFALCRAKKRIVDLGAAPGGWTQVAAEAAPKASVLAVDKKPIEPFSDPRIRVLRCDLEDEEEATSLPARAIEELGGKAGLVLCDVAPNTLGLSRLDNAMFAVLVTGLLPVVEGLLEEGGDWVVKIRHSAEEKELWKRVNEMFGEIRAVRSVASRRGANEIYWVARGFRAAK